MFARPTAPWLTPLCDAWRPRQRALLAQQVQLARIAAPTGNEAARGDAVLRRLARLPHLTVGRDHVGNVWATATPAVGHGRPLAAPVACFAHLDSVLAPSPDAPIRCDGVLAQGAGIGDNGRGLAALVALAHALGDPDVQARLTRPVHLVATVGEEGEGDLRGVRGWCDAHPAPLHAAIAIDGPGDEHIVHQAVGSLRLRIAMHGRGGHSWAHAGAPNPLHALSTFVAQATARDRGILASLARSARGRAALTVTRMHGGESLTGIPMHAHVDIDCRAVDATLLPRLEQALTHLAHAVAAAESPVNSLSALRVDVVRLGHRPAGGIDVAHPLVAAAQHATAAVGRTPRSAAASSDANVPLARGIPAIALGAGGRGGGAHTAAEWYDDSESHVGFERLLRLVASLATQPIARDA